LSYFVHNGAVTVGKSRKLKTQRLREINETVSDNESFVIQEESYAMIPSLSCII